MENLGTPWKSRTASPLDVLLSKIPAHRESDSHRHRSTGTESQVRISSSPRRSLQITEALNTPARSVYVSMQQMDSMFNQPDSGMRTTDFFDDSSEDDSATALTAHDDTIDDSVLEQRRTKTKKRRSELPDEPLSSQCESKISEPLARDHAGYQFLTPLLPRDDIATAQRSSSSLVGSVDELLPGRSSSPPHFTSQTRDAGSDGLRQPTPNAAPSVERTSRFGQTLGAFAIAHDITLQALMRNEEALECKLQPFPPAVLTSSDQESSLRRSIRQGSVPRSPKTRHVSSPPNASGGKKGHIIIPPIDTTASRRSLPSHFVSKPFPFSPEQARHKGSSREAMPTSNSNTTSTTESVLTLSIRQSNPSSQRRVTTLVIPASNDFSAIRSRSPRAKELHFRALDFDDAAFFRRLQKCYRELLGPWRFFSARSLQRIVVSGPAMRQADREYWVHPPRSPRTLASNGLKDTFSQEKILQHYRNPALGRSRYAFVHWAHRLAAAPPVGTPRPLMGSEDNERGDMLRSEEQPEGLEFVVSWSILRIGLALTTLFVVVAAAVLLWTFLGRSTAPSSSPHGGFRDAGDRITAGVVIGICLLLLGLSGIASWLGVSWLVM